MNFNKDGKPSITIDLRKFRIRIHKKTVHYLGNPEYVLLLVNPEECALVIIKSNQFDPRAHRLTDESGEKYNAMELYSRALLENICDVSNNLNKDKIYRIFGEMIPYESIARFHMSDADLIN